MIRIERVTCHVLSGWTPDLTATSSAQDDIVVEIEASDGSVGIGEADVNPWIARACIEAPGTHSMGQSLTDMLIGEDPLDIERVWQKLYVGSAMNGRRGAMIHALGALDIALHDLRGKILGQPVHVLLGGTEPAKSRVLPYASLQPETGDFESYANELIGWTLAAKAQGFTAAKPSVTLDGPYAHRGLRVPWAQATELIGQLRREVGPDFRLMIDVQYAFPDAQTALEVLRTWQDFGLDFVETPLASDDVHGYARLSREQPIPIAAGEWLSTRHEFVTLFELGCLSVAQPDIGRVGGLTEAVRVARIAADRGVTVIPHLWKTGISVAAAVHFAAVTSNCVYVEYLPADLSESPLRQQLLSHDVRLVEGALEVPKAPGLGVELNRDALREFAEAASHWAKVRATA